MKTSPCYPKDFFTYVIRERRFVLIDIRCLHGPVLEKTDDPFQKLQINEENKDMIQALVHSHLKKKEAERNGLEIDTLDLIRGKGQGVIILLHGVPGVGKTATAEAVASRWNKPLFPITCGDLGFTTEKVESTLNEIFRLAHLWGCVLLFDEADVFITQRERNDLQRNTLVSGTPLEISSYLSKFGTVQVHLLRSSVFLRMLEYYNGILFLTTNRAGVLDEAMKSRIHLSLRFDRLNEQQTEAIFRLNIERLGKIEETRSKDTSYRQLIIDEEDNLKFAKSHWRKHAGNEGLGRWNGRQIRNAFHIAASLAHYERDKNPNTKLQKQLRALHFEQVEKTTFEHDKFRASIFGATDSQLAHEREDRNDKYDGKEVSHKATSRPSNAATHGQF